MNIEQTLEQLAAQQYPQKVDVVDRVMAEVSKQPQLRPTYRKINWQRASAFAAAAVVALIAVNVLSVHTRSYDEADMGSMIAQVNDYSSWNTVEEAAVNPIEYLYIEETQE